MLEIIEGNRVSELDKAFAKSEGMSSWDLMERAAISFFNWFKLHFTNFPNEIFIFCGPGNNGGDGLAVARLLEMDGFKVAVVTFEDFLNCSQDYQINFTKLPLGIKVLVYESLEFDLLKNCICIDAIFGVGVNRPLSGKYLKTINSLNKVNAKKIAIDLPSGIPADTILEGDAFQADFTCTFQLPKLGLLIPEHADFTGKIEVLDIGIPEPFLTSFSQKKYYVQKKDIPSFHRKFNNFSHKGDFGRILLIGGDQGKMGAILLCSRAALRTGSGLVHVLAPLDERLVIQVGAPEVMVVNDFSLSDLGIFDAIGIGPGWGLEVDPNYFEMILQSFNSPVVIDADGLNILSKNPNLLKAIPPNSILTPHIKEFERLAGPFKDQIERLEKAREFSINHKVFLVLKGAFTCITCPDGSQYFNSSGNKYMATAGSGDVLTGMITSFLGQGYDSLSAAICGVFQHGLAGELASVKKRRGMVASDILETIPQTYLNLDIE
ncbi:NAD(P)H-hydrate dehydratase [Aquiflexum gelatinilyticum]|uniref:NAD(P)H-hydrate dehydratase n=1 Tax=Aquiflexum gelatinilyticum TaxID=2961943 RepID=UPI002168CF89|nr:NAD(P)H-hydrate dehydratase [Aquiflexum gelatinilyticum]MCS4435949.1 NAD(P)H-hydrate dehydratase [Aquiflexum gelatinilyticum]